MLRELLEQLEVGEAEAHALDLSEDLVRAGAADFLGGVKLKLAGADELNGVLG